MASTTTAPLTLNTGATMPPIGLGLWKADKGQGATAIKAAVKAGYRLFDGAAAYGNEVEVGESLREVLSPSVAGGASVNSPPIRREDLFVVSKCFQTHHCWKGDDSRVFAAIDQTLADLQLGYLDLWLMHWPFAFEQMDLSALGPFRDEHGTPNPRLTIEEEYVRAVCTMYTVCVCAVEVTAWCVV